MDGMGDVWASANGQVKQLPNEFGVEGCQIRDVGQLHGCIVAEERVSRVHRQYNWVAVGEAILVEDVENILSLMNPQLPGAPVALELNAKVLRDGSHVCDAEPRVQATLCFTEEKAIVAAGHTIIDMPG